MSECARVYIMIDHSIATFPLIFQHDENTFGPITIFCHFILAIHLLKTDQGVVSQVIDKVASFFHLPRKLLFLCQFPEAGGSPGQTARLFFTEEKTPPLLLPLVGPTIHCFSVGSQNRKVGGVEAGVFW